MDKTTRSQYLSNLNALVERDGSVEMRAEDPQTRKVGTTFKTRVLAVRPDGGVLVEVPTKPGAAEELRRGVDVSVLAVEGARRLVGWCKIQGVLRHELNASRRTRALHLSPVYKAESAQRRRFFRVNAGGATEGAVKLYPMLPGVEKADEAKRRAPLKAVLLNISGGGLGLSVQRSPAVENALRKTTRYLAEVDLPEGSESLAMTVKLVHVQPTHGDGVYLGFELAVDDEQALRKVQDQIVRVTTLLQRLQLRRQRGA